MNSVKITEKDGEYILYANGEEASHAQINIFPEIKNFDWILLDDVDTMPKYQRQGYAKMLLKRVLKDCEKKHPTYGQYLTVVVEGALLWQARAVGHEGAGRAEGVETYAVDA